MGYSRELIEGLKEKAKQLRRDVVMSVGVGVAGHIGGSNSAADLVAALYFYKMKYDPQNPAMPERDRFLLSKGHAICRHGGSRVLSAGDIKNNQGDRVLFAGAPGCPEDARR